MFTAVRKLRAQRQGMIQELVSRQSFETGIIFSVSRRFVRMDVLSGRRFVRTALDVLSGRRFVRTALDVLSGRTCLRRFVRKTFCQDRLRRFVRKTFCQDHLKGGHTLGISWAYLRHLVHISCRSVLTKRLRRS